MRKLDREAFRRARRFLKTKARPLDRAIFEFRFEGAPAERVVAELTAYQNQDGGFGHALEPDLRTPTSSALATSMGLSVLKELGCTADHPLVRSAAQFLLTTFDDHSLVWRVAPYDANSHPHAPWWHDEYGSLADTFDDFCVIPRAEIVGLLYEYPGLVSADWLDAVAEHTVAAIEALDTHSFGGGGDTLAYALRLAETRALPQRFRARLVPRLRTATLAVVSRDPQEWGNYCVAPLKIASSPQSIVADLLGDDLQAHLDYQIQHQTPEGTWEPTWTWSDSYPDMWQQAKQEWRGYLTLETLTTLQRFGRIEPGSPAREKRPTG
jgi:hypothetical protein